MNNFSRLDLFLLILGGIIILRGFVRGFISEFFSFGAPVLGLLGSILFHKNLALFLRESYLQNVRWIPEILAFIAVFLFIFVVAKIIQKLLNDIIKGLSLDAVDKVLGCIFGLAEAVVVVSLVLFVISIQSVFDAASLLEKSVIANALLPLIVDTSRETWKALQETTAFYFTKILIPG